MMLIGKKTACDLAEVESSRGFSIDKFPAKRVGPPSLTQLAAQKVRDERKCAQPTLYRRCFTQRSSLVQDGGPCEQEKKVGARIFRRG